ncbi:late blight resistance protein R1-A-like [Jatropha curcas]|uniref:late blight resistance protein R1-A-like n=1 Tax=Jatropha curcas TaxID=180498 RepID=UPI001893FB82|nr:late blight resistance protein R1-A-like [Jatropha curcas]
MELIIVIRPKGGDIEDLIDELIIRSAQRRSREAIIRCILSLVDLPRQFFYVLALIDLTDSYRFYKKLKLIEINVSRTFGLACGSGSWHNTFSPYDLEIGTTIVSPVISKFEALASKRQLRPAVRKQARWLRDEFKCLKAFLKDLESRETLSERGMAWTEELCDVCRSTENVVGLFLTKNEKGNPKSLVWSPRNFISQRNLVQQMARIQVKVSDISKRIYEAMHQRTWHTDRFPSITPPTATPEQLDIDMVCFEEDVDAVIKQLLKDDPRCLTISIVGVKGIGKTNLAKLICGSQVILDNFPHRTAVARSTELLSQRDATLEEWSRVLDQLNKDEEPWSGALEEINKYLPLYLRRCLFYFGLFPVGYKVPARRLVALWAAEGLGRQQNDDNSPEDVAEACLRELISYNTVQATERKLNGKVKTCCLPEALRVHWFAKAMEANFVRAHIENNSSMRRIADHLDQNDAIFEHIHGNSTTSLNSCYRDTITLLSFDTREGNRAGQDIGNFLDRCISSNCFRFLWVLDLENVYKPKLPKTVGQLTHLRYLGLRSTYLEMLPMFIDKLLNLQTLDLKRTCPNILPTTIWKMQKLRHLFLDDSFCSTFFPPQEPNSLMDLQTFWGVFIDENSQVKDGLDSLLSIRKLALKCKISVPSQKAVMSLQLFNIADWVVNLKHLQSLRLKSFDESGQPWDLPLTSLSGNVELSDF